MAQIGLRQAARLSGRNQSTLHRAMKAGRLSYTVDAAGQRRIDTAELDRVFGPLTLRNGSNGAQGSTKDGAGLFDTSGSAPTSFGDGASGASSAHAGQSNTAHAGEHAALERLLADREASIADLRGRLDASEAERRQLSERLTAVLTDRRETQDGTDPSFAVDMGNPITAPSAAAGLAIARPPAFARSRCPCSQPIQTGLLYIYNRPELSLSASFEATSRSTKKEC